MIELTSDATPVSRELAARGIEHRVLKHPGPLRSLEQAAEERGQRPEQVIRSIVFRTAAGEFVMVLVAGPAQIAWPALRAYLGQSRLTTASEEELLNVTGYTRGAVAPFALPSPMRVLVDRAVLEEEVVSMGSGVQGTTVVLRSVDMMAALPKAELGDFAAPRRVTKTGRASRLGTGVTMSEKRIRVVIVGIMLSLFLAAVESTVVATAMPTIVADLGGLAAYSWVFTAYMVTSTTTVPLYGKLSDLYGRRRLYFISMTIFLVGSVLSGLSQTMGQLIAFRALQGLGAGGVMPLAFTMIGGHAQPRAPGEDAGAVLGRVGRRVDHRPARGRFPRRPALVALGLLR